MEATLIIVAFINFIVLIMFFQLVKDVETIRATFFSKVPQYWLNEYTKHSYLKRDKDALYALQEYIWASMKKNKSEKNFEALRAKYEDRIKSLGAEFPDYPF